MQITLKATFIYHGSYTENWASQVAQWQRICMPIQEPQETQVPSLGWEAFLGGRNGNPFQYFCLGNPIDRGACWTIVHGVTKNWTTEQLSRQQSIHRIR